MTTSSPAIRVAARRRAGRAHSIRHLPGAVAAARPDPLALDAAFVRALDELGAGLVVFAGERILSVSDGFCAIVDRERGELLDLGSMLDLAPPAEADALRERLRRYLLGEDVPDHFDTVVLSPRRGPRTIEVGVKAIQRQGPRTVFALIARDVTDARREATFARILATASDAPRPRTTSARRSSRSPGWPCPSSPTGARSTSSPGRSPDGYAVAHLDPAGEQLLWELIGDSRSGGSRATCARASCGRAVRSS